MKLILILVLLFAAQTHAGLFDNGEQQRLREYEQQLVHKRQSTGGWQIIAGVLAIGGIVLFGVGAAIGAKVRKEVKNNE